MTSPTINDAPGLKWRKIKAGWQAIWRARADIVTRGYAFKYLKLWESTSHPEPDAIEADMIARKCRDLQDDMLLWAGGGLLEMAPYDKTWGGLVRCYKTDPDSAYRKKRYVTRKHYDTLCRKIELHIGAVKIADTDARQLIRLHEKWSDNGKKVSMGHAMIGMMRTITTFGATLLKCPDCRLIRSDLHDMRVPAGKPREDHLSFDQATMIRKQAHAMGYHSIALAQAIQFDGTLRQKDVIGEWVPVSEPGLLSAIISGNDKWVRGITRSELDADFILRHVTSKRDKPITINLTECPMVMEEISYMPATGPIIVNEETGLPWQANHFRGIWRKIAQACGIPDNIRNMDSRSGAITEALASGASMDDVRKSAAHAHPAMTARYSRGDADAVSTVLKHRAAHRNKSGTDGA